MTFQKHYSVSVRIFLCILALVSMIYRLKLEGGRNWQENEKKRRKKVKKVEKRKEKELKKNQKGIKNVKT